MSIEEVEALNPHFKWDKRKQKRSVMSRAKKLANGTYALGCRGHPGIIQNKVIRPQDIHGSDLDVVSLLDGVEGSCSIYHCSPDPISKEWALWLSKPFNHELSRLNSALIWCSKYDDFHEHWTIEQHKEYIIKDRQKVDLLLTLNPSIEEAKIVDRLRKAYDDLISGVTPELVDIGYSGETFRYHRGVRKGDFASQEEIKKLLELGEFNYQNKTLYESL